MWRLLRECFPEIHFRYQVPLRMFTADFASRRAKLVIEIDCGQHRAERDAHRTGLIEVEGYRLVRFWNHEVLGNPDGVSMAVEEALRGGHPHPNPPPSRGRGKSR